MPIVEWADGNGRKHWQPQLENGERLWKYWGSPYISEWLLTWGKDLDRDPAYNAKPALFGKLEARRIVRSKERYDRRKELHETGNIE